MFAGMVAAWAVARWMSRRAIRPGRRKLIHALVIILPFMIPVALVALVGCSWWTFRLPLSILFFLLPFAIGYALAAGFGVVTVIGGTFVLGIFSSGMTCGMLERHQYSCEPEAIVMLWKYVQLLILPHPLTHDYYPRHIGLMFGLKNLAIPRTKRILITDLNTQVLALRFKRR